MSIVVTPSNVDVPLIQEVEGTPADIAQRAKAFFKTAEFLDDAGADTVVTEKDREESREIFVQAETAPVAPSRSAVALHLKALITEYDHQVIDSSIQARTYILNRLLELSGPSFKPMEQLRALELMGKVTEIAMFTERLEININTKSMEELEDELVSTLSKYLNNASVVDVGMDPVLGGDLDIELGRGLPEPTSPAP